MEFTSKIFLDGGDPVETRKADSLLKKHGHVGLQGQTTNPSLIMKRAVEKLKYHGSPRITLGHDEAVSFYRQTAEEMADVIRGPISLQVIGDDHTPYNEIIRQARDRLKWIPNAVIKFPCNYIGIKVASIFRHEGPVNMTLAFTQEQAASVHAATLGSGYQVFISPFIGRLDDKGINGMDLVANILRMYKANGDGHVQVIAASIRRVEHIIYALYLNCHIISIPFSILTAWSALGFPVPSKHYTYDAHSLKKVEYKDILLTRKWIEYAYYNEITEDGVAKFYTDWKELAGKK